MVMRIASVSRPLVGNPVYPHVVGHSKAARCESHEFYANILKKFVRLALQVACSCT